MMVAAVSAPIQVFGVTLVGISRTSGVKLLFTVALVILVLLLRRVAIGLARRLLGGAVADNRRFWTRQGIQVIAAGVLILGVVSVWVTPTTNVSTGIGLVSAGLAFALQQVTNARNWFTPTDSSAAAMECAATPTSTRPRPRPRRRSHRAARRLRPAARSKPLHHHVHSVEQQSHRCAIGHPKPVASQR